MMSSSSFAMGGRPLVALSDDVIRQRAPSVFALGAHESRSTKFAYIPTHDILAGLRAQGFVTVDVMQSRCRIAGKAPYTKHLVKMTHASAEGPAAVDKVVPQLCLKNAHDGSAAYELSLGLWRYVCANGLMCADGTLAEIRVPHVGDVRGRVIEGAFNVIESSAGALERVERWRGIELRPAEQDALARQAIALRFDTDGTSKAPPIEPRQALRPRRPDDARTDLWTTYNVLQENLIRGGQRYIIPQHRNADGDGWVPTRRMATREVRGIDQNVSLNRALWRLTEEMATLKAGAH